MFDSSASRLPPTIKLFRRGKIRCYIYIYVPRHNRVFILGIRLKTKIAASINSETATLCISQGVRHDRRLVLAQIVAWTTLGNHRFGSVITERSIDLDQGICWSFAYHFDISIVREAFRHFHRVLYLNLSETLFLKAWGSSIVPSA